MIVIENGLRKYFDKNGTEITKGCTIRYESGRTEIIYETNEGELGVDATNPRWIANGRAGRCEYGVYPLSNRETELVEVVCSV